MHLSLLPSYDSAASRFSDDFRPLSEDSPKMVQEPHKLIRKFSEQFIKFKFIKSSGRLLTMNNEHRLQIAS